MLFPKITLGAIIMKIKKTTILQTLGLCILLSVTSPDARSQGQFEFSIGGAGEDRAYSIIQTSDGGLAMAGFTSGFGTISWDLYIVKLDANNNLQWSRTIGGAFREEAYEIIQTRDGGYAVAGYTYTFGQASDEDMYIVKLDSNGTFQWHRSIGAFDFGERNREHANSVVQTFDGGYVLAGYSWRPPIHYYHIYVVKLDENGDFQWSRVFGGSSVDIANSIIQTSDSGYALAGYSRTSNADNFYIAKLDKNGFLQWNTAVGGSNDERAYSIIQTIDGGYAVAGETLTFSFSGANQNMYIVKLDSIGSLQWTRVVGGTQTDRARDIVQTSDGDYIVTGHTNSHASQSTNRVYIAKLNSSGELLFTKTVGGTWSESASSITLTRDGGFATAGFTLSYGTTPSVPNMYVLKFDSSGYTCENSTSFTSLTGTAGTAFTPIPGFVFPPTFVNDPPPIIGSGGSVTSICLLVGTINQQSEIASIFQLDQNYPNPFNPSTVISYSIISKSHVTLRVFDLQGREIKTLVNESQNAGRYSVEFNAEEFSSGIYFYELRTTDFADTKRMILLK